VITLRQESKKRISYYLFYSLVFVVITALVFSWFYLNKRSLAWRADGVRQHLVAMTYYGEYLRQILRTLVSTGRFVIPHFNFSIGYGSDILTTLNWYAIGDPLNLLFAAVPVSKAGYLYTALVIFRLYLMGVAFSAYCRKLKLPRPSQLFGSLAYVFCGFVLQAMVHPNFLNPMIYLPLLLIGIEQVFEKQRPYFFIAVVCLAAVTDFYFFYMLTILIILYIVIRFFSLVGKDRIKSFFSWVGKFALFYLTGLLTACLVFLPVVMYMLSTSRASIHQVINSFYTSSHYLGLIPGFITSGSLGSWVFFGYSALSFVAVILLFTERKAHTALKFALILLTVFLMLPIVGYVFNGLSYVTNRWVFGYSFVIALITAVMLPDIMKPTRKQLVIITVAAGLYLLVVVLIGRVGTSGFALAYLIVVLLLLFMWATRLLNPSSKNKRGVKFDRMSLLIIFLLMALSIVLGAYYKYAPTQGDFVSQFTGPNAVIRTLTENSSSVIKSIDDASFYRYDENEYGGQEIVQNRSMLRDVNSTGFYFSLGNRDIIDYFIHDIGLYVHQDCNVYSLDNRTFSSTLASVKYFVVRTGQERYLPYGYNKLVKKAKGYRVYENSYTLPLGYTYDKTIPKATYEKLSPVEKQQAFLQGAVGSLTLSLETTTPAFNDEIIPYRTEEKAGVTYENNAFVVTKKGSSVTLRFLGLKDCETYLYLKNLNYSDGKGANVPLTIKSGNIKKKISYQTPAYSWYANQHDYLVNLGYAANQKTEITISFNAKGAYSLDDLQVVCQPMSAYGAQVEALKQTTLKNVDIGIDRVTGTISTNKPKLLCLTIPYSKGWSAYVDGKRVNLFKVNSIWCGLNLPAGNHAITLCYATPYFKQGCILSLVGLVLFVIIIVCYERRRRAQSTESRLLERAR